MIIFKGKTKPSLDYVGTISRPRTKHDKFGMIPPGNERRCLVNTQWGQLYLPKEWMDKTIKIEVTETLTTPKK